MTLRLSRRGSIASSLLNLLPPVIPSGEDRWAALRTSIPWQRNVEVGDIPLVDVRYDTAITQAGQLTVSWQPMPASGQAQKRVQITVDQIVVNTNNVITSQTQVASADISTTAVSYIIPQTLSTISRYLISVRIQQTDNQWSDWQTTRAVKPSGITLYLEDYGVVADGVTNDKPAFNLALGDAGIGDTIALRNKGREVHDASINSGSTQVTSPTAAFTGADVGKEVWVLGASFQDSTEMGGFLVTTISSVQNATTATLALAAGVSVSTVSMVIGMKRLKLAHIDADYNRRDSTNTFRGGGYTLDGRGWCSVASDDSLFAGFRNVVADTTFLRVTVDYPNPIARPGGINGNYGSFFAYASTAVGQRYLGCWSRYASAAAFLIGAHARDCHVVDCFVDRSRADPFHTTNGGSHIRYIRPTAHYIGDDMCALIGYASDGQSEKPTHIAYESPHLYGQDWGRGVGAGGCDDCTITDLYFDGTADAPLLLGADGDQMDTQRLQVLRGVIKRGNYRSGLKPTYSQGAGTSSTVPGRPQILLLARNNIPSANITADSIQLVNSASGSKQIVQIITYDTARPPIQRFDDPTIKLTNITAQAANAGNSWYDVNLYDGPQHPASQAQWDAGSGVTQYHRIDLRGISVPAGSNPAPAPLAAIPIS